MLLFTKLLNCPLSKHLGGIQPPSPQKLCSCPVAAVYWEPSCSLSGMEKSSTLLGEASGQAAFPDVEAAFSEKG